MHIRMGVCQNYGYHFRGPHNKDYSILGSILGSPYLGKLPYVGFGASNMEWTRMWNLLDHLGLRARR